MDAVADGLLIAGAIGVAFYCFVLSRRLTRFTDLERGVGGAVAVLSGQVDDLKRALNDARSAAETSGKSLDESVAQAEAVARKLELHMASLQDLPDIPASAPAAKTESTLAPRSGATPATQSFFSRRATETAK